MAKNNSGQIDKFFKGLEKRVVATAGIVASSYAKEATKTIAEEWAEILARNIELGIGVDGLAKQTEENRIRRGNPSEPPWMETGRLVEFIEFRWTQRPNKNYDTLEVGIFDDDTLIGHSGNITPYKLGLMNEYGFVGSYTDEDGNTHDIIIPARPHFRNSASQIGYEKDRIFRDTERNVQVAMSRQKKSILNNNLLSGLINKLSVASPNRYGKSGPDTVTVGKFFVEGNEIKFKWVSGDAANSSNENFD